jgi:hypothetical protein
MAQKLKFGNGTWATKKGSTLSYNDEGGNYKPLPFTTTRNSIATRVNKEGLIEVVGNDVPRIDYTDSADGALLLENSSTNLITYSNKFDTYWSLLGLGTGSAPTIINNSIISPDGKQNATEVILNVGSGTTTSDRSSIEVNQTVSAGSDYTVSFYIKGKNDGDQLMIGAISGGYELITLTTEWKRYTITQTAASSPRPVFIGIRQGVFGALNNNVEFYLYGAQLEQGSCATSYIPTNGSAVTRVADTASGAGNSEVFNDSEGVLFANIAANANDLTIKVISINDNSGNNVIRMGYAVSSNEVNFIVRATTNIYSYNQALSDITTINKLSISYSSSGAKVFINGFLSDSGALSSLPTGLSQLDFRYGNGSFPFYGKTKELAYYNTVLTDLELETLTSYRSLNELVTELNLKAL